MPLVPVAPRSRVRRTAPSRVRSLVAAAVLASAAAGASVAVPAAQAAGPVPARPNACTLTYAAPAGDAPTFYVAPSDPDLDVTRVTWAFGPVDVVVTAQVAALGDRPVAAWGDRFDAVVYDRTTKQTVSFGYFRTLSGGGPTFGGGKVPNAKTPAGTGWSAYPGGTTHLVADFDRKASQVVLTVPRADLAAAFGVPTGRLVLTGLGVNSYAMDAAYSAYMADFGTAALDPQGSYLAVADCDRWLAKRGVRAPAASPCVVDVVAPTGDEASRTSDAVPTRDDSVDVARATFRLDPKNLVVTVRVARLTDRPLFGTGQGYAAAFQSHNAVVQFGVTRDAADGTKARQYAGRSVTPLPVTAAFDSARQTVTLTIPRTAIATALGLASTRSLVVADLGVTSFWTLDGQSVSPADGDAQAPGRTLSFAACDRSLHR
jgi:hypothetical protein